MFGALLRFYLLPIFRWQSARFNSLNRLNLMKRVAVANCLPGWLITRGSARCRFTIQTWNGFAKGGHAYASLGFALLYVSGVGIADAGSCAGGRQEARHRGDRTDRPAGKS